MRQAMSTKLPIEVPQERLAAFCRKHRIRKLSFFGSVLREDFAPESDVDVLVEFEPGAGVGLITFAGIEIELSELIGRKADLRTPAELSRYFRDEVLAEAVALYVQA
jgi:predicted nucleotidyltransferase